ncbi:putative membrane protein YqjE [Streptomyces sp. B3I7]|uniref:hypothetical protein n=1 Tax=Streptomyces sp. B3I7 TaxID=3042269 RepID=UPI00278666B0|nr:hypothetical protein [Streptomyces sp. B3I7]MDQ0808874.1 putative membrane protein YqjE [Streptomyces sp. B3I7]
MFLIGGLSMLLALFGIFSTGVLVVRVRETERGVSYGVLTAAVLVLPRRGPSRGQA